MNLKQAADLASKILKKGTKYAKDKLLIKNLFKKDTPTINEVFLRLTVIDNYYSTQMNKRLYGLEDLAKELHNVPAQAFTDYLKHPEKNKRIDDLFHRKYGLSKGGKAGPKAPSLISKYAYFLTNYCFPIYDSVAKETLFLLYKKKHLIKTKFTKNFSTTNYFKCISEINKELNINNFDKLDNLLWLFGKIRKCSFSTIFDQNRYGKLMAHIKHKPTNKLNKFLHLKHIFKSEETKFMKFVLALTSPTL